MLFFLLGIMLFSSSLVSFGAELDNSLKEGGYTLIRDYITDQSTSKIREKTIYPEDNNSSSRAEADKLYPDNYRILTPEDALMPTEEVLIYYPGVLSNSTNGLTGLFETVTANTLKKGHYSIGGHLEYYRITKTYGEKIKFSDSENASVRRFPFTCTMGIAENFELGLVIPIVSWKVHTLDLEPSNAEETGVGDIQLKGKFRVALGDGSQGAAVGFGIKFPSGDDETLGLVGATGAPDLEIQGALSSQFGLINSHLNMGYVFTGDPRQTAGNPYQPNADKSFFRFGFDYSRTKDVTLSLEIAGENQDGSKVEFIPGVRSKIDNEMILDFSIPLCLYNTQYIGHNFRMIVGATYTF